MPVNWFPKHMRSSEAVLRTNLKFADVIFEVLDARLPFSSRDPRIDKLIRQKPRIVVLNKCDLSDEEGDRKWVGYFKTNGFKALSVNAPKGVGIKDLAGTARGMVKSLRPGLNISKTRQGAVKVMVVGIPNVGKSTIINALAGKKKARIANKPGITRVKQRVTTPMGLELLDTPGILWPRDDEETLEKLAMVGAVKDELLDLETLSISLLAWLKAKAPENVTRLYGVETAGKDTYEILEAIALKRGCIQKNKGFDSLRVSRVVLGDFRKGKLGRITLEFPEEADQ